SAIAAFFYLRVIVLMFLEEPRARPARGEGTFVTTGAALLVCALVVLLGVFPAPLIDFARRSLLEVPGVGPLF
ncbi:MAG: NADH-quinone oxidoreductase subunit NuoN, partial [Actinomycetota bacterium]